MKELKSLVPKLFLGQQQASLSSEDVHLVKMFYPVSARELKELRLCLPGAAGINCHILTQFSPPKTR